MPNRDVLTSLVQRLVQLVGLPSTLERVRTIPKLVINDQGNVVAYDQENLRDTVRLLLEQYEIALQQQGTIVEQPVSPEAIQGEPTAQLVEPDGVIAEPTKIMVVDDHALVREGLVGLISSQPDLQIVGEAGSVRDALVLARNVRPDLILMDFTLPDGTGDEATRIILSTLPNTKIIFLTVHDDDERLLAAISAGAVGYLLKSIRSTDLLERLRGVIRGDVALSPVIGKRILEKLSDLRAVPVPIAHPPKPSTTQELTGREREILLLIVQGHTNRQIAYALNLSVRTVEYHRANLTSKLNLHTRAELVRYAVDHGLLGPKD